MTSPDLDAAIATVNALLAGFAGNSPEAAFELLSDDVVWRNTGMPTMRGARTHGALRDMLKAGVTFSVTTHHIAASAGNTPGEVIVLTDRTDVLGKGPVKTRFHVNGTFVIRDGKVTLWDDHFTWTGMLAGFFRRG